MFSRLEWSLALTMVQHSYYSTLSNTKWQHVDKLTSGLKTVGDLKECTKIRFSRPKVVLPLCYYFVNNFAMYGMVTKESRQCTAPLDAYQDGTSLLTTSSCVILLHNSKYHSNPSLFDFTPTKEQSNKGIPTQSRVATLLLLCEGLQRHVGKFG